MKKQLVVTGVGLLSASMATAAHLDLSGQSSAVLFEKGTYAELSFGTVSPSVSGVGTAALGGGNSGNMAGSLGALGFAFKKDFGAHWSAALIFDQPFAANVSYPNGTGYFAAGTIAKAESDALTALVKYRFDSNVSLFGGLRYQTFAANVVIPYLKYIGTANTAGGFGYVAGAAYEKPEIGLRVALTYNSKINGNMPSNDSVGGAAKPLTTTSIDTPQSVNLDAQMGLNKSTLLFGTVRWVNWSAFSIAPPNFLATYKQPLIAYKKDTVTYTLGVGHKFTDNWSGAVTVGYEAPDGGFSSSLGPSDGLKSVGLAAIYTQGNMKVTGGVQYTWLGNATVENPIALGTTGANFSGSHAVGVGVKVGYTF